MIEPRFQRDFISLLPRELALHVLSNLKPADLMGCAQTCRTWRTLADDNLLWQNKCLEERITGLFSSRSNKTGLQYFEIQFEKYKPFLNSLIERKT